MVQKILGCLPTDCKSLYNLLRRTGSMPTEKRIALDLMDARENIALNQALAATQVNSCCESSRCSFQKFTLICDEGDNLHRDSVRVEHRPVAARGQAHSKPHVDKRT